MNVSPGAVATQSGANIERQARINLRGLDTGDAVRTLMMIDGMRFPGQGNGVCATDPSIIPSIALDRIDILADGASATYGSDAIAGVINIVLKRAYDGAMTQLRYTTAPGGKNRYQASQLWGRTWDGGDITLSYEWYDDAPTMAKDRSRLSVDYSPWGLDNRTPLTSSLPGTLSTGAPATTFPGGFAANSRHLLHQLLRHSQRHGPGFQSDQWRHRTDGAVQRLDAELDDVQRRREYRQQRHAQRVQSLYARLVRRGAAAQRRCRDRRSAADQEYHLQWRRLLQQPPRRIPQSGEFEPEFDGFAFGRDTDLQPLLSDGRRTEQSARELQHRRGKSVLYRCL